MLTIRCPRCKQSMADEGHATGTIIACSSCGQKLRIPVRPDAREVNEERVRNATLAYWGKFISVSGEQQRKLGASPSRMEVADSYSEGAKKIMSFPTLEVDLALVEFASEIASEYMNFYDVLKKLAVRHEWDYGAKKMAEGLWGGIVAGLTGNLRGAFQSASEEWVNWKSDCAEFQEIQRRMKGKLHELNLLRTTLTAKYRTEFAVRWE